MEFLGVLPQAGPSGDLILVRVSGDVIDRTGGIAAGMSGSPVYIGDRLVGAIGYGYDLSDHRIGLVTPIHDMLPVMELLDDPQHPDADAQPNTGTEQPPVVRGDESGVYLAESLDEALQIAGETSPGVRVLAPVQTPLMASGFSSRALSRLEKRLGPLNLVPVHAGSAPAGATAGELEEGSAFGVQLMTGDINLTSIGTVTYVEDGRFVGFGHPFTNRGAVEYLATSAYIHYVVPSISIPFKLGSPLAPVGSLVQDRGAAVAGRLGALPRMVPVTVTVHDRDRGMTTTRRFSVVHDEGLLTDLAAVGALAALDAGLDRLGRGTARVVFQIRGEGMPRPLVRDNVYYSDFDISALSVLEFMEAVSLVVNNRFSPVRLTEIQIAAQVEEQRWTAHIEDAQPEAAEVRPGETVKIHVRLRPFRGEAVTEVLTLTVPREASPGTVSVTVRGGGWGLEPPLSEDDILEDPESLLGENVQDLERLIEEFVRRERNNEIVAEFYSQSTEWIQEDSEPSEGEAELPFRDELDVADTGGETRKEGWQSEFPVPERVVASQPTDFVVLGSTSFELYILPANEGSAGGAAEAAPGEPGDGQNGLEAEPGSGAPDAGTPGGVDGSEPGHPDGNDGKLGRE